MVFVGGEAGAGKSSLLNALLASPGELRTLLGRCGSIGTGAPYAPILDACPALGEYLTAETPADLRHVQAELARVPTMLALEDVHWADDATLAALRYLAGRVDRSPLLVIATYRDDPASRTKVEPLLGGTATYAHVRRVTVPPLTRDGVAAVAGPGWTAGKVDRMYSLTGGNPFLVMELLDASLSRTMPARLSDSIAFRSRELSAAAQRALAAAAVVGAADAPTLTTVAETDLAAVDECIAAGLLKIERSSAPPAIDFHHELVRHAVYGALTQAELRNLHGRALQLLRNRPTADAVLAHHAERCGDSAAVLHHAVRAGRAAFQAGAIRDAASFYRSALTHCDLTHPERATLLEELADTLAPLVDLDAGLQALDEALVLRARQGDDRLLGLALARKCRITANAGDHHKAGQAFAEASALLASAGTDDDLSMLHANYAISVLLRAPLSEALANAEQALALAREPGSRIAALSVIATAHGVHGDYAKASEALRTALDLAAETDQTARGPETAARRNIVGLAVLNHAYADAIREGEKQLAFAIRTRRLSLEEAVRVEMARAYAGRGDFATALAQLDLLPVSELGSGGTAQVAAALRETINRRRNPQHAPATRPPFARPRLGVSDTGVILRLQAESCWLDGCGDEIPGLLRPSIDSQPNRWHRGEVAWWLHVTGDDQGATPDLAEPFELMIRDRWSEAADAWEQIGAPLWQAYALGFSPDADDARRGLSITDELGAAGAKRAILRSRQERGLPLPAMSSRRTGPLTARQLDVLKLVARGMTNGQIAEQLFLSERTVAHHVAAILRALEVGTRMAAAQRAAERGYLH